jgi:hypothetical protein
MVERIDPDFLALDGLRREPHPRELAREAETVTAMAAIVRSCGSLDDSSERRRRLMLTQPLRVRTLALVAATMLAATSTLATAGALPAPAQDVVSGVLDELGITLPDQAGGGERSQVPEQLPSAAEKGAVIADLATGSGATGVEKGAAISAVASDGQSRAGNRGAPSDAGSAPVETPNDGGTSTANTASNGSSLNGDAGGTDNADSASDGRSAAGSGNADVAAGAPPVDP